LPEQLPSGVLAALLFGKCRLAVDSRRNISAYSPVGRRGKGIGMHLTKLAGCSGGTCPAVYATDRGTFVVQGSVVTDPDALATMDLPAHETAVEVPAFLLASLKVEP
jgi:hypothetical protein